MKTVFSLLFILTSLVGFSQDYRDTTFTIRDHTCSCKYNHDEKDDNILFERQPKEAAYPGGEDEWDKFVKKNLYKGFKGRHEVVVRFQVEKNGSLTGYTLLSSAPASKYEEAVRILRLSGKWFPSVQKGFCVKSYVTRSFLL